MAILAKIYPTQGALSLEDKREKYAFGTLERIAVEGAEYDRLGAIAKESTNELNRQKTQLSNSIKSVLKEEDLGPDDWIYYQDKAYKFDYAFSEKLPIESLFDLFNQKKINKEQFLGSLMVNKEEANRLIGSLEVEKLLVKTAGKKADVRTKELSEKDKTDSPIIVRAKPKETTVSTPSKAPVKILSKPGKRIVPLRKLGQKAW